MTPERRVALVTGASRRHGIGAAICRRLATTASLFPGGRINQPVGVARVAAFLVSDEAASITGQVIHAEGGFRR